MDDRYNILFEPVKIGPVTAPNRFFAVPHATGHGHLQPNGAIAVRAMKAEGGWGTVAVQITEISADTDMANHPMEKIWDDSDIPRHAAQVSAIKRHGSLAGIELGHGGMRARNLTTGQPVLGPSARPVLRPEVPVQTRAMDLHDIRSFRESHKAAAGRAKAAGYDILYVYAAHDLSILSHFLSVNTNTRSDAYGGRFENRLRLLRETLEDTLEVAAGACAVALRFSVAEPGRANGLCSDGEGRDVVEALAELPDLWDVNISGWPKDSAPSRFAEEGFQLGYTDFVKSVTRKPVVGVGRFTSPDLMVSLVKTGRLDLIGAARPSIADPFLPNKIRDGRVEDIRECIGCNVCVSMDAYGLPLRCTQNPTMAEEWRRGWHPEVVPRAARPLRALIIGSGPAGLECALTLARAGHEITVAEKRDRFGGRVARERELRGLSAWGRVVDYRLYQLRQLGNVSMYTDSDIRPDMVADFEADHIIVATGATWRSDGQGGARFRSIPGFAGAALTPDDIMDGVTPEGPVVIYDNDNYYMGSVLAGHLASRGAEVHLVCPLPVVGQWMENTLELGDAIDDLTRLGVRLHPNLTAKAWTGSALEVARSDTGQSTAAIPARSLVDVSARNSNDGLLAALKADPDFADHAMGIGDCIAPGIFQAAVFSGHAAARQICDDPLAGAAFRRDQAVLDP